MESTSTINTPLVFGWGILLMQNYGKLQHFNILCLLLLMTGMGDRQKIQATQQRNSMKKSAVVLSKQEEYHLPPDIGLPRDWTY